MPLQSFVDKVGPIISAAWLNAVDSLKFTVFDDAVTKATARTALTTDAPLEVVNGGTGQRSLSLLAGDLNPYINNYYDQTAGEAALSITPVDYSYPVGHSPRYGTVGIGTSADDYTALQNCMNAAYAEQVECVIYTGKFKVSQPLVIPGDYQVGIIDDRSKGFIIRGAGFGEPFSMGWTLGEAGGTTIWSSSDTVLKDIATATPTSNGTIDISRIRFETTSSNPVIRLTRFYGQSRLHSCMIYQAGTGDGFRCDYNAATTEVENIYALNKDWNTNNLYSSRTGVGFNYPVTSNAGLQTIRKCTSRGFRDGFVMGGGAGTMYSPAIHDCESSTNYNGITLNGCRGATVAGCYFEGGDLGTAINNIDSDYTTIRDNFIFSGFAFGVVDTSTTNKGTTVDSNLISMGSVASSIAVSVYSNGYQKNILNNTLSYTVGTAGVKGIVITGVGPTINLQGNLFDPGAVWTGTGSYRILDSSTGDSVQGLTQIETPGSVVPMLSRGAVSYEMCDTLTEADVAGSVLTLGEGTYYVMTATGATAVGTLLPGEDGRLFVIRTTNANVTFSDGANMKLDAAAPFASIGTIEFLMDGGIAYEQRRSTYT